MATDRTQDRVKRRIKPNEYTWCMEVQGDCLHLEAHPNEYDVIPSKKGRRVLGFSDESRRRLIRLISRIDWSHYKSGLFVTVTLPDGAWPMDNGERTRGRHRLIRDMENTLEKQFPAIWRIEWKARQSGWWQNNLLPHWHLIVPGIPWLDMHHLRELWRRILRCSIDDDLCTDVQGLTDDHHQQVYICKYAAKVTSIDTLDSVVQLNTGGRHWGIHRRNLLAMHEVKRYDGLSPGIVARLRRVATGCLEYYDPRYDGGFTIHGPTARKVKEEIREILLDCESSPE